MENRPSNIEAEQALLGAMFVNNDACDRVSGFLKYEHFSDDLHGRIYEIIIKLVGEGKAATPTTLHSYFADDPDITPELTAAQYLSRLAAGATTVIGAEAYGKVIYDLAVLRSLSEIGEDMMSQSRTHNPDYSPTQLLEQVEESLYRLAETGKYGKGFKPLSEALSDAVERATKAKHFGGGLTGISSGFKTIDNIVGGLQDSDLLILAGRPSMGKTALATNIAHHVAANGKSVGFFSLEMSSEQLATRIISEQSEISSEYIRRGTISDEMLEGIEIIAKELEALPLHIDQTGGISIDQLCARARRLKRQHGVDLIIVDYLQLLSSNRIQGNRVQEVTEITTKLKALAKELNVPILALSQLSRAVEQRDDKRPQLSDLRESGSIEQDADVVMFVYREEYYVERAQPREGTTEYLEWQTDMDAVRNLAELIVGKQRHGPTGTVRMQFTPEFTRFRDLAEQERYPENPNG